MLAATPTVFQTRGVIVESVHPFSAVAVMDGEVVWSVGEAVRTPWRSAAKPFQLACSLDALGPRAAEVGEREQAVGAASHSAEPVHLELVRGVLARFGLDESFLRCGTHPPVHVPSMEAVLRAGERVSAIHNNCSGKHAFMLAASAHNGWPMEYRPLEHPLQVAVRARLESLCGGPAEWAVDGCGVPTFAFPVAGLARAWGALAGAMAAPAQDARLSEIGWAMARNPELTSGTGRLDLDVVRSAQEPMAVKIGAMGVFCLALPLRRLGIAIKIHTGVTEALGAAIAAVLEAVAPGSFDGSPTWEFLVVRNVAGLPVGGWQASLGLPA